MNTSFEKKLYEKLNEFRNKKFVVGFSGGRDSSALLHFLNRFRNEFSFELYPCHINHRLRKGADEDEEFALRVCREYSLELEVISGNVRNIAETQGISAEQAARKFRIESFAKLKEKYNADYIVTAHHMDDLIETFFLKIFQGTAVYNLKGFNYESGAFFRPMLEIGGDEIDEYINAYRITYVNDPTNWDINIPRNWIRHKIIPEIKKYNPGYLKNILKLQNDSSALAGYLNSKVEKVRVKKNGCVYKIDLTDFKMLSEYEKKYLISSVISEFCRPGKQIIENILDICAKRESRRINLPNDFIFEKSYNNIYFFPSVAVESYEYLKKPSEKVVILSKIGKIITFGNELKDKSLKVRNRRKGDRFGREKIKDLFIDAGKDLFVRDTSVIVEKEGKIIFVEGLLDSKDIQIDKIN
ncbi:MAG: tRNA lysidine(34) synthetase TilS [Flexistipes sinusarabici]|uniref:tRNA(Ile)-lysidine synthase n=1 Tax=Flexistipes sinusarabici TaxID=2352 RepID=A0A5D0MPH3_FLESI|nr:tRNA lysidine(34) synthetase TilS [Flexistipes sinusarabici]TYB32569.1 MAG: tRNA lysidine(34) synthetase TilS [Flexistipes sinusarabici]